jgi:hypothetical protein
MHVRDAIEEILKWAEQCGVTDGCETCYRFNSDIDDGFVVFCEGCKRKAWEMALKG